MINAVIDISHHQSYVDFNKLKASGIVGVIHKVTQGIDYVDPNHLKRMSLAKSVGLLWGAYHFGDSSDVKKQFDFFTNNAKLEPNDLAVLDFEEYPENQMSLTQARDFAVLEATENKDCRFPTLYTGAAFIHEKLKDHIDYILANCPLWIAQYNNKEIKIPSTWQSWTLWQYTDGVHGNEPHYTNGVGNCDRNIFNGDLKDLIEFWG